MSAAADKKRAGPCEPATPHHTTVATTQQAVQDPSTPTATVPPSQAEEVVRRVRALNSQGFRTLPIKKGAKNPAVEKHVFGEHLPEASRGPEWFSEPGMQIAILCGNCPALPPGEVLVVADVDGEGDEKRAAWLATLPSTLTSHDGRHLFFRMKAEDAKRLRGYIFVLGEGDRIDLKKSSGAYVRELWDWAPGTNVDDLASQISFLPLSAFREEHLHPAPGTTAVTAAPTPAPAGCEVAALTAGGVNYATAFEDAIAWIETKAPLPDVAGGGGAALMLAAGGLLVGFGLAEEDARCLLEHYCKRAWPGQPPDKGQIQHKIKEIREKGSQRYQPLELARQAENMRWLANDNGPSAAIVVAAPATALVSDAKMRAENLATWSFRLQRNAKGEIRNTAYNTALTLELHPSWAGLFGYDEFRKEVFYRRAPEQSELAGVRAGDSFDEDHHPTAMRVWFAFQCHQPRSDELIAAVHHEARKHRIHAVREYLASVRGTWDGVDRNLAAYLGLGFEQTGYQRAVCAKWMRSAVARAMDPGCKVDTMLILEGPQGRRKSTGLRELCPDVRWYFEVASRDTSHKDFMQDMRGKWLCEIPEVDQLIDSRHESELKALLSRRSDNYRPSYARKSSDFPRELVFSGTTNKSDYLRDATGNRRYWIVRCGDSIDPAAIARERDQLWAQALAEYEAGLQARLAGDTGVCVWWLTNDEGDVAAEQAAHRLGYDESLHSAVEAWVATGAVPYDGGDRVRVRVPDVMAGLPVGQLPGASERRVREALGRLGYESTPVHGIRYWTATKHTHEAIVARRRALEP